LRALSYGLALDRLVGDSRGSEALFGRVTELIFRGLAAESKTSQAPEPAALRRSRRSEPGGERVG
jgi:hypothetical protein